MSEPLLSKTPALWQVELTNRCPYSCVGCPRRFSTRPEGMMSFATFKACVLSVEHSQKDVPLGLYHFGESLLHPHIARFIAFSAKRGISTELDCNPGHLSPELGEALLRAGLNRITFSLDGLDTPTLQQLRGPAADYPLAKEHIIAFLDTISRLNSPCEVFVQMIAYKANQHQWAPFLEEWKGYPVRAYIKKFDSWTRPELASLGAEPRETNCIFPYRFAVVLWDGRVVPCCHDYDGEVVLGSIYDGLQTVWNGERYRVFRRQFSDHTLPPDHMCRRCAWWPGKSSKS